MNKSILSSIFIWFMILFSAVAVNAATITLNGPATGLDGLATDDLIKFSFTPVADAGATWTSCSLYTTRANPSVYALEKTLSTITNNAENVINLTLANTKTKFNWKISCIDSNTNQFNSSARTLYVNSKTKLIITKVKISYEKQESSTTDSRSETFEFEDIFDNNMHISDVAQDTDVDVEVTVKNFYSTSLDRDETDIDASLVVESLDYDDIDDKENDFRTIDAGDDERSKITLHIPLEILEDYDQKDFDFRIRIEGEDGNRTPQDDEATFTLEIKKPRYWINIKSVTLSNDVVSCYRDTSLRVKFSNAGYRDLDDVMLYAYSSELGFSHVENDIELDNDITDYTIKTIPIKVKENQAPGTYKIYVKFFKNNDENDLLNGGIAVVNLEVKKCQVEDTSSSTKEEETSTQEKKENTTVTTQIPNTYQPVVAQPTPVKYSKAGSIDSDLLVVGLLATLNVLLLLVGIFVIMKFSKK